MKKPIQMTPLPLILALLSISAQFTTAHAQGTAFTCQGRLNDTGSRANGIYDMRFSIYDAVTAGNALVGPITNVTTGVTNGLFTVTLDPGAGVFNGNARWLEIGVRTNGSLAAYTVLSPRQPLTPSPYAIYATSAGGVSGLTIQNNGTSPNVIAGFSDNAIGSGGVGATISGGGALNQSNSVSANYGSIGGGSQNAVLTGGSYAAVGGGFHNDASGYSATIAGGNYNEAISSYSTIGGGSNNVVSADYAFVGGGSDNQVSGVGSVIAGGGQDGFSLGGNTNAGSASVIGGGFKNLIQPPAYVATIGGGKQNLIVSNAAFSTIAGGLGNQALSVFSSIGGGQNNFIQNNAGNSAISGGVGNQISGAGSFIGGGGYDGTSFAGNSAAGKASVVAGGIGNTTASGADYAIVGGGYFDRIQTNSAYSTIGGGLVNQIQSNSEASTIAGGEYNAIQRGAFDSMIGGGFQNTIQTFSYSSTIGGGESNTAIGPLATVPGGDQNVAGANSFAAGHRAKAVNQGNFVWADSTDADFAATLDNQFAIRASGGAVLFSDAGATVGVNLAPGSGSWSTFSDRNAKENFEPVDPEVVLSRLAAMPLATWNYKTQHKTIRYIGPMAQDFHASFGVGENDTTISTVDEGGVALAAIQGLNQKLEARDAQIAQLKKGLAELKELVDTLTMNKKQPEVK
jgi:hypothetical protein